MRSSDLRERWVGVCVHLRGPKGLQYMQHVPRREQEDCLQQVHTARTWINHSPPVYASSEDQVMNNGVLLVQ